MHTWGDGFPYFDDVSKAADEIGQFCRRWGRLGAYTKEKYGTCRVHIQGMGYLSLFSLTHPGYVYSRYPKWLWSADIYYIGPFLRKTIGRPMYKYQCFIYRLAYKRALKKYPNIREEILCCADFDELLKDL